MRLVWNGRVFFLRSGLKTDPDGRKRFFGNFVPCAASWSAARCRACRIRHHCLDYEASSLRSFPPDPLTAVTTHAGGMGGRGERKEIVSLGPWYPHLQDCSRFLPAVPSEWTCYRLGCGVGKFVCQTSCRCFPASLHDSKSPEAVRL